MGGENPVFYAGGEDGVAAAQRASMTPVRGMVRGPFPFTIHSERSERLSRPHSGRLFMQTRYVLYQRDYCHLCDQALAVMAEARAPDFDSLWVDDDETLEARYGTRVPVLRDSEDGREMDWPFDAAAVRAFVGPHR